MPNPFLNASKKGFHAPGPQRENPALQNMKLFIFHFLKSLIGEIDPFNLGNFRQFSDTDRLFFSTNHFGMVGLFSFP